MTILILFYTSNPLYPQYKPACSITSLTVKLWWKYAYNCIRHIKGRRAWIEFMEGFRKRKQYIASCTNGIDIILTTARDLSTDLLKKNKK